MWYGSIGVQVQQGDRKRKGRGSRLYDLLPVFCYGNGRWERIEGKNGMMGMYYYLLDTHTHHASRTGFSHEEM
jgi:hypothetical protein